MYCVSDFKKAYKKKTNYLQDLWANKSVHVNFTLTKILDEIFWHSYTKTQKLVPIFYHKARKNLRNLYEFENWLFKVALQWGLMRAVQAALQWRLRGCCLGCSSVGADEVAVQAALQ